MFKSRRVILAGIVMAMFLFSQCKKDNEALPADPQSTKELSIPENFNFQTSKNIALEVEIPKGIPWRTIYVMSPDETKTYLKSMPVDSISRTMMSFIRVPSYINKVLIKYGNGDLCESEVVSIESDYIDFSFSKKSTSIKQTGIDTDGDQVIDSEDEYPDDPERAYDILYPGGNTLYQKGTETTVPWSTYVFEDQWPRFDDFDFNDLVVDYYYNMVISNSPWHGQYVKEMNAAFRFRAAGSSYKNGFGIELTGIPADHVEDVYFRINGGQWRSDFNNLLQEGYIDLRSNHVENNQQNAVLIVTDNVKEIMQVPQGSSSINTDPDAVYHQAVVIELKVLFSYAKRPYFGCSLPVWSYNWTHTNLCYDMINPFVMANGERGKEIHLPGKTPTNLMNKAYFGLEDDASNLTTGKYYKSANGTPWALDINYLFKYPAETNDLINAYPALVHWAQDGGHLERDWYLPEHCAPDHIYQVP